MFMNLCAWLYLKFEFFLYRTPSLLSLLILTALRRLTTIFRWKTVGMLVNSFSLPATCVQRVGDPQRIRPTAAALMSFVTTWSSSAPLRSWNCLSAGWWRVLGWPSCMSPSQLHACMWLQLPIWWAEFHWSPCSWAKSWLVTQPLPFLTSTDSTRGLASLQAPVTLQQQMAGVAAMCTR